MRNTTRILAIGIFALASTATAALALDAASVEKARGDYFHGLGRASKGLRDALKSDAPDMDAVRGFITQIAAAAPNLPAQFPAGSGPESGVKTEAKAEIWSNPAKFKQDAAGLATAAQALNAAGAKGDVAAIRTAADGLGQACKTCHSEFKNSDH
ncbi:MAG: c-type cytochrome [Asticcacaulis sp.]